MISYLELSKYKIMNGPTMVVRDVYTEDGHIVVDATTVANNEFVRLHPVGIGQLWRIWVDFRRHNIGKLIAFILGRPVYVYGYINLDKPRNRYPEYPMFVGVWLDYRDAHDLMQLQYRIGFCTNGVLCFDSSKTTLPKNIGFPNNPIVFETLKMMNSNIALRSHIYIPTTPEEQTVWVYDVHTFVWDHFGRSCWPTKNECH